MIKYYIEYQEKHGIFLDVSPEDPFEATSEKEALLEYLDQSGCCESEKTMYRVYPVYASSPWEGITFFVKNGKIID
jgi:hypothetical protein